MVWQQVYDPLHNPVLSTLAAGVPVVVMLGCLAAGKVKAHLAALAGLAAAGVVAVFVFDMPYDMAVKSALLGGANGLMPIGWIVLNVIFLYQLTEKSGSFQLLQRSVSSLTDDRRLQVLFIAFTLGAFFEGAAGFGTPVAVCAAMMIGLGFTPLAASALCLMANTAPVAFGALATPILTLAKTHGYDVYAVTAMVGRQLPFFSLLVPFWLIAAFAGLRAVREVWPAALVCGGVFAVMQFLVSNYIGPELVDVIAALVAMVALAGWLRVWRPASVYREGSLRGNAALEGGISLIPTSNVPLTRAEIVRAWFPWAVLSLFVFVWGTPFFKSFVNTIFAPQWPVPGLHEMALKMPPVAAAPHPESAIYSFNLLSATGTGIFCAALIAGNRLGFSLAVMARMYVRAVWKVRHSLLTIMFMMGLGALSRFSGSDSVLGLAFAQAGWFYPFFGTLMGWLGVALTGSDTASNVLFGGMQRVAAEQLGLSPNLMGAANTSGGVMGKMVDAQSIVVATAATGWANREGQILRFVAPHSLALATLVGLLVMLQAYCWPFTLMVVR